MANAKIISFVAAQVAGLEAYTDEEIEAARRQTLHDISFIAGNLRHDLDVLAAAVNKLQAAVDAITQGGEAIG